MTKKEDEILALLDKQIREMEKLNANLAELQRLLDGLAVRLVEESEDAEDAEDEFGFMPLGFPIYEEPEGPDPDNPPSGMAATSTSPEVEWK